jgi:hypothetical protein
MPIPTENVGSLPRPARLQEAIAAYDAGTIGFEELAALQDAACQDSIERMEATGSPIVSDGEQRASSFATYPITDTLAGTGLADHLAADGQYFAIFDDGHHRQLPRLTSGPFRYRTFAADYLTKSLPYATKPMKQAVIAPSMLSLLYPLDGEVDGYSRGEFLADLCDEAEKDIRQAFAAGAARVSIGLHRGPARVEERPAQPLDGPADARAVHRAEQPGHRPVLGGGAGQSRRAHVPGWGHGLGALRGCRLRRTAALDVPDERRLLPDAAGQREGQGAGVPARRRAQPRRRQRRPPGVLHRRHRPAEPDRREGRAGGRRPRHRREPHPGRASRGHRRLRVLAVQHRRQAKHGSPDFARDVAFAKIAARVHGVAIASERLGR